MRTKTTVYALVLFVILAMAAGCGSQQTAKTHSSIVLANKYDYFVFQPKNGWQPIAKPFVDGDYAQGDAAWSIKSYQVDGETNQAVYPQEGTIIIRATTAVYVPPTEKDAFRPGYFWSYEYQGERLYGGIDSQTYEYRIGGRLDPVRVLCDLPEEWHIDNWIKPSERSSQPVPTNVEIDERSILVPYGQAFYWKASADKDWVKIVLLNDNRGLDWYAKPVCRQQEDRPWLFVNDDGKSCFRIDPYAGAAHIWAFSPGRLSLKP